MWDWYDINKTKCHYEHLAHTHTWPDNEQKITMVLWLGWCPKNTDSGQYGTTKREKKLFLQNLTITCNLCHILDAPQKGVTQGEQMEADQAYSNSSPRNKLQVAPNNVRKCLEPGVTSGPGFGPGMLIRGLGPGGCVKSRARRRKRKACRETRSTLLSHAPTATQDGRQTEAGGPHTGHIRGTGGSHLKIQGQRNTKSFQFVSNSSQMQMNSI